MFSDTDPKVITTLTNTIVSGNREAEALGSDANNVAGNIEDNPSCNFLGSGGGAILPAEGMLLFNIHNDDPDLKDLAFFGGPTQTHLPNSSSLVINAGDPSFDVNGPDGVPFTDDDIRHDQRGRGFLRVFDDVEPIDIIDIGAVEYGIGDPNDLPTVVVVVIISGSNSVHDDYSFSEAFEKGIHEFSTVPVGGADTIEVVFSEWVDVEESDLWLYGGYTQTVYTDTGKLASW